MTESLPKVRSKAVVQGKKRGLSTWIFAASVVLAVAAAALAFEAYTGVFGIFTPNLEVIETSAGRVIKVPPGGNLQAAIDQANGGDIVELTAGAAYYGGINLPNKPLTDYVTIRTSAADQLPPEMRVGPAQAALMAKIMTRDGKPAVTAVNGAHHYRFIGIEFGATSAEYVYNLVLFGNGEKTADLPHDLEIDRSYLRPSPKGIARRGIALNSAATTIKNSYIEGFAFAGEETQGICGWTGSRNIKIINNYVEGGAENIMFGGSDPATADLSPTDIEIRGNHLNKPAAWRGKATMKTLFELKNAKRVQVIGNLFTNNWVGAAFRLTVRNQDGNAPFATLEDITVRDNVIRNAGDGINILGKDDTHPSGTLKRLVIENNLLIGIAGGNGMDGSGYLLQAADGEDITFANNTAFNRGNTITFYGTLPRNFVFRDNIVGHGNYGIHAPFDLKSATARAMFQGNLFLNLNNVTPDSYAFPPGNSMAAGIANVGFSDVSRSDYRLSSGSKYRGKGRGGKDIGSSIDPASIPPGE